MTDQPNTRARLGLDKRVPPLAFAVASPGTLEGDATAKARGGRRNYVNRERLEPCNAANSAENEHILEQKERRTP